MQETELVKADCPYCGETIELVVDPSAGSQSYIEDCFVCCRPISVHCDVDNEGDVSVWTAHEDD